MSFWAGDRQSILDFMDNFLQELDCVRPVSHKSVTDSKNSPLYLNCHSNNSPHLETTMKETSNTINTNNEMDKQNGDVKVRQRPVIPPKPPIDALRYSMANIETSPETDLDALLNELLALETQLSSAAGDSLLLGMPALPVSPSRQLPPATAPKPLSSTKVSPRSLAVNQSIAVNNQSSLLSTPTTTNTKNTPQQQQGSSTAQLPLTTGASRLALQATSNGSTVTEAGHQQKSQPQNNNNNKNNSLGVRTGSPDADSAFGEGTSIFSSHPSSNISSSADSSRGSLNTPSPTQHTDSSSHTIGPSLRPVPECTISEVKEESVEPSRLKADKIKQALEKMKEANMRKLYVKFFARDGCSKSLLVDERWTVAEVLRQLADKHRIPLTADYALVEHHPDLFMERIYEDDEQLVENILMWTRESSNKIFFIQRPDKYAFVETPQLYLFNETERQTTAKLDADRRRQVVEEFFALDHIQPPDIESWLYLKADGKKSWKRHYFVLRASGLYYIPKGKSSKTSSKDLICLMNFEMNQIYVGMEWKRKYKAPSDYGFAIKHPQIQVKASKYIKFVCAKSHPNRLSFG